MLVKLNKNRVANAVMSSHFVSLLCNLKAR